MGSKYSVQPLCDKNKSTLEIGAGRHRRTAVIDRALRITTYHLLVVTQAFDLRE